MYTSECSVIYLHSVFALQVLALFSLSDVSKQDTSSFSCCRTIRHFQLKKACSPERARLSVPSVRVMAVWGSISVAVRVCLFVL